MNFKYTLAFFLACTQLHALDITEEFCKKTNATGPACPQFKAFIKTSEDVKVIHLVEQSNQKTIGGIVVQTYPTFNKVDILAVNPEFQSKGYGSKLLKFALTLCTDQCQGTFLQASPISVSQEDEKPQALERLKKFYRAHGGKENPEQGTAYTARFDFEKHSN